MPLTIAISETPVGPPSFDSPANIAALAASNGHTVPSGGTVVGITVPVISHDFTQLAFHTRNGGAEFRFNTGTLQLAMRQEIHVSNGLGPCARTVWLQHEMLHVADNGRVLGELDGKLRADAVFASLLVTPVAWHPRSQFANVQRQIADRIGAVFRDLTSAAAHRRDTAGEYRRVERQIRLRCDHTVDRELHRGEYGQGIDILQYVLNTEPSALPELAVDGIFGPKTEARVREYQHQKGLPETGRADRATQDALGIRGL